ncbi:hypothetical protein A2985_00260 [Candidatus Woesebacteria bacterium RIFCSPLOWO2_01_FULL_43_11]|uniref:UDP-N-acetylglucosamine--N-acetylmuramyl-(pentapeptide) pyrophosphoryl-undecaprenol N-acetylglucosamine transferase n=1 Tax=Candidatus Woesebacteria bacterium RBG_16_42_24 TaxID=1802485 RepID=A0A1F7XJK2_9BACT|nr:MAG: hypothetical protein A2V97_00335 [Candidatus Woesebacteria bacterium RBG_16_42_24]OGM67851.1 MAG: hypothetical protein A2985_00260 [Candidatus Woesebacteria bacterium RIFCSPLOWO2_01_FULL_43_11]
MPKTEGERKIVKIVLTGGHAATTALSVIEELNKQGPQTNFWDIYWIGPKSAIEGKKVVPIEESIFPRMGVKLRPIISGRLQMRFTSWTIPSFFKIPLGFFFAFWELSKINPDVILSFGGFAAFPVVLAGYLRRIPVIVHEQTVAVGRANKYSAYFAQRIALARVESMKYFPQEKCIVTGNPTMAQISLVTPKNKLVSPPTIFVTGGSRGSLTINSLIEGVLPKLLTKFKLIHHTGPMDYKKFSRLKHDLPGELKEKYQIFAQIDPMQMGEVYKRADLVIARAGANTVSEIMITKIPSILIPIPWSYEDEQTKNAKFAEEFGIAKVLRQDTLTSNILFKEVLYMVRNWDYFALKTRHKISPDTGASKKLVDLIKEYV